MYDAPVSRHIACMLALAAAIAACPNSGRPPSVIVADVPPPDDIATYMPPDARPVRPPDADCGGVSVALTRRNATVILVIDRSGSMADATTDGQPKWDALRTALQMSLPRLGDDLSVGMTFFPAAPAPRDSGAYTPEEVCTVPRALELEPAPARIPLILDRFNTTLPGGPTPTMLALRLVRDWYLGHPDLVGDRYVILATDGGPNCNLTADYTTCRCTGGPSLCSPSNTFARINCLDAPPAIAEVRSLAAMSVRTFVIGLNGTQDFADVLNDMADAGGRPRGGMTRYYNATSATELVSELGRVTQALADCTLRLDAAPPDPNLVDVRLDGHSLYRDVRHMNGWDWSDETHREIIFHGPTCDEIHGSSGGSRLAAAFGCPAPTPP